METEPICEFCGHSHYWHRIVRLRVGICYFEDCLCRKYVGEKPKSLKPKGLPILK